MPYPALMCNPTALLLLHACPYSQAWFCSANGFAPLSAGAPSAALFFGLRLCFTVLLSAPILGSTAIHTPVQIAGIAVVAAAVTCYAVSQWWAAKQQQRQREVEAQADAKALAAGRDGLE